MTGSPKDQQKQRRAERLSEALRGNLKRRKAQAKGRNLSRSAGEGVEHPTAGSSTETHDSAGFGGDKRNNS